MRNSKCKLPFKSLLGILVLLSGINVTAANNAGVDPVKDSVVLKTASVGNDTLTTIQRPNPMDHFFDVLPEVFESFGLNEKKLDKSFRLMSHGLSRKIAILNKYSEKQVSAPNSKMAKQLLSDLELKIGGSSFETRELKPDFVAKFTPENVQKVSVMLTTLKQYYDNALKQKTLKAKLEQFKNIGKQSLPFKDVELCKAFAKEYGEWIKELMASKINGALSKSGFSGPDTTMMQMLKLKKEIAQKRDQKIYDNAYTLSPEQVKISSLPYNAGNNCQLVKIVRGEKETKVTLAIAIHFDWNWISTDSVSCLIDKQTNDCYYPRRIESGIPLNRVIIVKNCAKKMIEITYVYPPLKKSTLLVDFVDLPGSTVEIPSNSSGSFEFKNVFVDDYSGQLLKGNVYR